MYISTIIIFVTFFFPVINIGSPSHEVTLDRGIFSRIKSLARTPGQFVLNLIDSLFEETILARSNITGTNGKEKLDEIKIDAIKGICKHTLMTIT